MDTVITEVTLTQVTTTPVGFTATLCTTDQPSTMDTQTVMQVIHMVMQMATTPITTVETSLVRFFSSCHR